MTPTFSDMALSVSTVVIVTLVVFAVVGMIAAVCEWVETQRKGHS